MKFYAEIFHKRLEESPQEVNNYTMFVWFDYSECVCLKSEML